MRKTSNEIYDRRGAARYLRVSMPIITRLCNNGLLRYLALGRQVRIRQEWLDEYMEKAAEGGESVAGKMPGQLEESDDENESGRAS